MTRTLVSHGYDESDARRLLWDGYSGGMAGARAVARQLDEIPEIADHDVWGTV